MNAPPNTKAFVVNGFSAAIATPASGRQMPTVVLVQQASLGVMVCGPDALRNLRDAIDHALTEPVEAPNERY